MEGSSTHWGQPVPFITESKCEDTILLHYHSDQGRMITKRLFQLHQSLVIEVFERLILRNMIFCETICPSLCLSEYVYENVKI